MKEDTVSHVNALSSKYMEWQIKAGRVMEGWVGLTIHGTYIEDYIGDDQKAIIRDVALRYCAREMIGLRAALQNLGAPFVDGIQTIEDLMKELKESFGQKMIDLTEAKRKGG